MSDPTLDDYQTAVTGLSGEARAAIMGSANDNPETAAKAYRLSQVADSPPETTFKNFDEFNKQIKARMAGDIVSNNPILQEMVREHPLFGSMANDDLGNLDKLTRQSQETAQVVNALNMTRDAAKTAGEVFNRAYGDEAYGSWLQEPGGFFDKHRLAWSLAGLMATPAEMVWRGTSAAIEGAAGGAGTIAQELHEQISHDPERAAQFGRAVAGVVEYLPLHQGEGLPEVLHEGRPLTFHEAAHPRPPTPLEEAWRAGSPWFEAGVEPPRGVHPLIDQAKAQINSDSLDILNRDLEAAQDSYLKERDPETFNKVLEKRYADRHILIDGDAVAALYEGKEPHQDDGLLGWVPDIQAKLALARETGEHVAIPMKDWLTNVDPAIAKLLNDDIRMWAGGVSKREAMEPWEPKLPIDAPLAQVRGAHSLEPIWGMGDRRVDLVRREEKPPLTEDEVLDRARQRAYDEGGYWNRMTQAERDQYIADAREEAKPTEGWHQFTLNDEAGKAVGFLTLSEHNAGKEVFVQLIQGFEGHDINRMGPSLMNHLLGQIAEEFPNADWLSGHRITGARAKAGTVMEPHAWPRIDLNKVREYKRGGVPYGIDITGNIVSFKGILKGGQWVRYLPGIDTYLTPRDLIPEEQRQYIDIVNQEGRRLAPKGVEIGPATVIVGKGVTGVPGKQRFLGIQAHDHAALSSILWSLTGPLEHGGWGWLGKEGALWTIRHEVMHHLRQAGFIQDGEWAALEKASIDNGWQDQFDIHNRYSTGSVEAKLEESIVEAFSQWRQNKDLFAKEFKDYPLAKQAFVRLAEFLDRIKDRIGQLLGREPTFEDVFRRIDRGEVGRRKPTAGMEAPTEVWGQAPEVGPSIPDFHKQLDQLTATAGGLDVKSFERLQQLLDKRFADDIEVARKRADREQKKTQTMEWKSNLRDVTREWDERLRDRPDMAADLFFNTGELGGVKLPKKYRISSEDLTPEEKAALPANYVSKTGLPIDQLAKMFGFPSRAGLIEALTRMKAARGEMSTLDYLGKLVRQNAEKTMAQRFGDLKDNIMEAAHDQALSDTQMNLIAEEYYGAASLAKTTPAITKEAALQAAKDYFAGLPVSSIDSHKFKDTLARHGRDAERALIANDPATALVSLQKKMFSSMIAKLAMEHEADMKRFMRIYNQNKKFDQPGMLPEYKNWVQRILKQTGLKVSRSMFDIDKEIAAASEKNLADFIAAKKAMLRDIPVWPELYNPSWQKSLNALTTEEFNAVYNSIRTLNWHGRNEMKVIVAGEKYDLSNFKRVLIGKMVEFKQKYYDLDGNELRPLGGLTRLKDWVVASHIQMENLFYRWDKFDAKGPWSGVLRELISSSNEEDALRKTFARRIRALYDGVDLSEPIHNPLFKDPTAGPTAPSLPMTRKHLRVIMLNLGSESNARVLAGGYGLEEADIVNWVNRVATKKDWDFVQGMWDIFKDIKSRSDTMYRSMTGGVPAEDVLARPIATRYGQYAGGYYPLIHHESLQMPGLLGKNPMEQEGYFRASTPAGYMKDRTGAVYPVSLNLSTMYGRMAQMLHDIALRPAVTNASKIFYDKDIYNAIRNHYGQAYADMLVPYLRDVANARNFRSRDVAAVEKWSEFFRQNMVTALVGFNPGTVLKHGMTAAVQSMQQVGMKPFMRELIHLFGTDDETGNSNFRFAMDTSQELQRRMRNAQETLYGAGETLEPAGKLGSFRQAIISAASKPVALADLMSAVPTWLAAYRREMADHGNHGLAVEMADRDVRFAHGSSAITSKPSVMRTGPMGRWITSLYNFYNHMMNHHAEMVWRTGEAIGLAKAGDYGAAKAQAGKVMSQLIPYVIIPAVIEQMVQPMGHTDKDSWAWYLTKAQLSFLAGGWTGVRDIARAVFEGGEPTFGLAPTAMQHLWAFARDLEAKHAFDPANRSKLLDGAAHTMGALVGIPEQFGRTARFLYDWEEGRQKPHGPWGWLEGLRYGQIKGHSQTLDDYMAPLYGEKGRVYK